MKRLIAVVAALGCVLLVQLTIVNGLPLPGGGQPDLVLLCVVAIGLTAGPRPGLTAGFLAGLALDLAPPATQLVGQNALVFCLVGYFCGRLSFTVRRSALLAVAVAAAAAVIGEAFAAALSLVVDTPNVTMAAIDAVLPSALFYDAVLSPLVLLLSVRLAMALGMSFSVVGDTPAAETGGSAARSALAGAGFRRGQRSAWQGIGGSSRAAANGRWLVGDDTVDVPAVGAVGWLTGPASSRSARRRQARLTGMVTGATPRQGSFWVGRKPPGLVPAAPSEWSRRSGPTGLRPGAGVAGSAWQAETPKPAPPVRPVRLDLAGEQRRRARSVDRAAAWRGVGAARLRMLGAPTEAPDARHGPGRHGLDGPLVPRIAFGNGALPGPRWDAARRVPTIAFGSGALAGASWAAGPGVPRIAFATGALPGAGRAAGRGVPKIAFGSGDLARSRHSGRRRPAAPKFRSAGPSWHAAATSARKPRTPRMSAAHRSRRWLPWGPRAGGRSTVWRIGSRIGGSL